MYDSAETYQKALETNKGASVTRMVEFKRAIDRGASTAMEWLDRAYMMRYLAVDRLLLNDDGIMHWYCVAQQGNNERRPTGNHNYYWYEAAAFNRFWLIPWDLDSSLNDDPLNFTHVATEWTAPDLLCICMPVGGVPQRSPSCDPLTRALGTFRSDYEAAVAAFVRGPFAQSAVDQKLDAWSTQITPFVNEAAGRLGAPSARAWRDAVSKLQAVINRSRTNRGFRY